MVPHTILYNAFTGLNAREKTAVIRFLYDNISKAEITSITDAVDYAVKHKPSFGGFVLTAQEDHEIVAAIVANRTGMDGYGAKHLLVYAVHKKKDPAAKNVLAQLLRSAVDYAGGEVSLRVESDSTALKFYETIGFRPRYVEMHLEKARLPVRD